LGRFLGSGFVDVSGNEVTRTFGVKAMDERTADPARRPRDYDTFVLDFHGGRIVHSSCPLVGRPGMGVVFNPA